MDVTLCHGGVVDSNRPDGRCDELIGFVTARVVFAKESEIVDLLGYDSAKSDQTLVYILTLGVVDTYRKLGIASSLIKEVIKYASSISTCRAVYLHLLPAIVSYLRSGFKLMAARLCKSDDRKISKWAKCKESHSLVSPTHNKRNLAVECTGYDVV
ncbi:Histone acetyltransferase [Arachis hypogaea]|nr:Histone acetyltransferase [Arachis hypogaea]